mmetsp:Transcript_19835/g.47535  ORF Transcript_19835/g.47535 Transcript_19835/m.47535 type:complete len:88 (-) Transcript_19835:329-592(-)
MELTIAAAEPYSTRRATVTAGHDAAAEGGGGTTPMTAEWTSFHERGWRDSGEWGQRLGYHCVHALYDMQVVVPLHLPTIGERAFHES